MITADQIRELRCLAIDEWALRQLAKLVNEDHQRLHASQLAEIARQWRTSAEWSAAYSRLTLHEQMYLRALPDDTPADCDSTVSTHTSAREFRPNDEQVTAIAAFRTHRDLKVTAFAGTGKTSTLELMARADQRRGLYVVFNKDMRRDAQARFPRNVTCHTTHSLAWNDVVREHGYSQEKMNGQLTTRLVESLIESSAPSLGVLNRRDRPSTAVLAFMTKETVLRYLRSADTALEQHHVWLPDYADKRWSAGDLDAMRRCLVDLGRRLWVAMQDHSSQIPLGHDGYLKLWLLADPSLQFDYVMLDEAQDTNPAVLHWLLSQPQQKIVVGDQHQQIYQWRGAVNAMEQVTCFAECALTLSYRFGESIADHATKVLRFLGEKRTLCGDAKRSSEVRKGPFEWDAVQPNAQSGKPPAILCRKNSTLFDAMLKLQERGKRVSVRKSLKDLERVITSIAYLEKGIPPIHEEFYGFRDWNEFRSHAAETMDPSACKWIELIDEHGTEDLLRAARDCTEEDESDVILSTTHAAKGLQWDSVFVCDDHILTFDNRVPVQHDEARLYYVAATRARSLLCTAMRVRLIESQGNHA